MQILLKYEKHFGLIVFVCAFLLYANTIWNKYNMDDELVTINHRNTSRGLSAVSDIFKQYYYEDDMGYKYEYRPITHLSFAIEHEFLGESPHISHAINVLLYALGCFLLFVFLRKLLPQNLKLLAWIATLLFVFHPIHTEVVASIKNRDEILAMIFGVMSGILLLNAHKEKKYWLSIFAAGFFLLALLSKPTIFPFLMIFPIGLMFFDNLKFKELLYLVLPLGIAGYISVNLIYDNDQSFLVYVGSGLILLFYSLQNLELIKKYFFESYKIIKTKFISFLKKLRHELIDKIKNVDNENNEFYFLIKKYSIWIHFLLNLMVTTLIVFSLNYRHVLNYTYIVPFFAFVALLSQSKKHIIISNFFLWFSIFFIHEFYQDIDNTWSIFILTINFILIIFHSSKKTFYYNLIAFTFIATSYSILYELNIIFIIGLVGFLFAFILNYKKNLSFIVISILLIILNFIIYDFFMLIVEQIIFILFLIISYKRTSFNNNLKKAIILHILFLVMLSFFSMFNYNKVQYEIEQDHTDLISNSINIKNSNNGSSRPLNFVESPVHGQSPTEEKIATGTLVFGKYLKKVLLPYPMGFYYGYAYITPQKFDNKKNFILLSFAIILLGLFLFAFFKKYYIIAFGLLIYLSTISQVVGIFYPIPGVIGDRFLFLPSLGFSLVFAWLIFKLINHKYEKVGYSILIIALLAYSFITIQRNFQWKDRITLFESDIEYLSESAQAHALLGYAYMQKANETPSISDIAYNELALKAKKQFEKAIQIYPDFVNWWYDKSRIEGDLGLIDESLNSLKKSISLDEGFLPDPYFNIANIYFYKGEYQDAIYYYNETIKWGYNEPVVYNSIAVSYIEMGNLNATESVLLEAYSLFPNNFEVNLNLGLAYIDLNNTSLALKYLENAQRLNPENQDLKNLIEDIQTEEFMKD